MFHKPLLFPTARRRAGKRRPFFPANRSRGAKEATAVSGSSGHVPVLARESLELLGVRAGGRYLDATFGGGGHSRLILNEAPGVQLWAMDRDPAAAARAADLPVPEGSCFTFLPKRFSSLGEVGISFDGILFDFGVSSFQLDQGERGFSFRQEAPLDMRMDTREGLTAAEWLAQADYNQLREAFRDFGEEKQWGRLARAILGMPSTARPKTTRELAALAEELLSPGNRSRRLHPATRIFQGLRIAVNGELEEIARALPRAFEALAPGGVLVAISFHSLEDRLVKRTFRKFCGKPEHRWDDRPQQERTVLAEDCTRKPIKASADEQEHNPRSRSAVLRAIRKKEDINV